MDYLTFIHVLEGANIVLIFASSMLRLAHEDALLSRSSRPTRYEVPEFLTATKTWGLFHFGQLTFGSYTGRHFGCRLTTLYKAA